MIVLWAMSLWAAMGILTASQFFVGTWSRHHIHPRRMALVMLIIWIGSWFRMRWPYPPVRVDLGFVFLLLLGGFWMAGQKQARGGWLWIAALGLFSMVVRLMVPFSIHQASLLPVAAFESVGVGIGGGLAMLDPLAGAVVSLIAAAMASVAVGVWHHSPYEWGRHDTAAVMIASLSGWLVGWIAYEIHARLGKGALDPESEDGHNGPIGQ